MPPAPPPWSRDVPARCFVRALDDAGLPVDPEFRAAIGASMRWAVDNVLSYSAEDAVVVPGIEMPRLDWDGLRGVRR